MTGNNAFTAIDLTGQEVFDQQKMIYQTISKEFGSDNYFVLSETFQENKSMKKRFKVCSIEDTTTGKIRQIWFLVKNL